MADVMIRKLMHSGLLSGPDVAALSNLVRDARDVPVRIDVISRGENPEEVHLVLSGVACRYKILPDGRRAIVGLILPGDFCNIDVPLLRWMDHSIGTLTRCRIAAIPQRAFTELLERHPQIARAMRWATLVDEAILREWLVNVGKRQADKQMGHLYCEIFVRLSCVGAAQGALPGLTLEQWGDALGISAVHAQRVQMGLREQGLISVRNRHVWIEDFEALAEFAEFEPDYLHLSST